VTFVLKLRDGKLVLAPLDFGVAGGHVTSHVILDASRDVIQTQVDAIAKNLEVKALLPKLKAGEGSAGQLGGRGKLTTKGNSIAQMLASANGELALIMSQGRASTLSLVLSNLDLANATRYLLFGDLNSPVYCAVVHASMREGMLVPDIFVIDTSEENITGDGAVDFKDERYKLRLVAHSKHPSLIALRGPISIAGTFKDPQIGPEIGPVAARVGTAIALGAFLTPVASLLVLADPGGAKNSNCPALIGQARREVANTPVSPPKTPATASAG
jgi:AsmA family protein